MDYVTDRDQEQLAQLNTEISSFISRHKRHSPSGPRKTIILFPGGMGSSLKWAHTPHGVTPYSYDKIWLDCPIMTGGGHLLKMEGDLDADRHFVIADGCVHFSVFPFIDLRPYESFLEWCEDNEFDWFVFGWDWRRRPELVAAFFLNHFVPKFRHRVQTECGVDPFDDVTLLGHSFGGMVIKLILNHGGTVVDQIERAITVGTPFYGHAGHLHRYFKGDPDLDGISDYDKRNLTELISSMRGPYTLLYLDEASYQRDKTALARDAAFPLLRYPLRDDATGTVADPYEPGEQGSKVRYPRDWGFVDGELGHARTTYQQVAQPLSPVTNVKFHNIRAVQRKNGANAFATIHEQRWQWIDRDFDPLADETPIEDKTVCPGDGVIPAWSARLISTPPDNVHTVFGEIDDGFEHMDLMSCESIQNQIFMIMQQTARRSAPMVTRKRIASKLEIASRKELDSFLAEVKREQSRLPAGDETRHSAILATAAKHGPAELQRLMRRAFTDLPKSLSQKLGKPPTERSGEPLEDPYAREKPKSKAAAPRVQRKPKGKPK
jgi:pimeloyl-ACP methyl ester carboxylesterase